MSIDFLVLKEQLKMLYLFLKGNVRNFQKLKQHKYLIKYHILQKYFARKSRKSRTFFSEIFKSEFSILAVGQNRKFGIIFPRFPRFPTFPSFPFATFSISSLIFFSFFINVFSKSLFYICNYSSTLCFIDTVRLSH